MTTRRAFLVGAAALPFARADAARPMWVVDRAVAPGDDFYGFVNDVWLRGASIPPALQEWSDFARLEDVVAGRVRAILDTAARTPTPATRAFGDLYASLLDNAAVERDGLTPIAADLARIDAIGSPTDLARALGAIARATPRDAFGVVAPSDPVPATPIVFLDTQNPTRYRPTLIQGGLGLPDRDYYLVEKPAFVATRDAYRAYVARLLTFAGAGNPESRAAAVCMLEERMARAHRPRVELFDFAKRANPCTLAQLTAAAPQFDWETYLDAVGYRGQAEIILADPAAAAAFAQAVGDAGWPIWRDYARVRLLDAFALAGPTALARARFQYRERALNGATEAQPAWRRAGRLVDLVLGQSVGAAYQRACLPSGARASVERMVDAIKAAMRARIVGAGWMADATRAAALEKLALLRVEIGGPARVPDTRALRTDRTDAWGNLTRAAAFAYDDTLSRLSKPVDRGVWDMLPHSVNGMANPLLNKIMFSAGMMQPPLYDPLGDAAVSYGALGAFIAHEVSHLFDNVGSRFDAHGRMRDWWTPEDRRRYDAATTALAAQFDAQEIAPGLRANGRQTLHENVADLTGVLLAHDAYRLSLGARAASTIDGFTGEQRFFLGWARMWRTKMRDAAVASKAAVGTHSMGRLRANTVRNLDEWYEAFEVRSGQRLYLAPEARVRIW